MLLKRWQTFKAQLHPLASRLAEDPYCRLQSLADVTLAAQMGFIIDVNQATVDDWLRLPGISIRQAQRLERLRQSGVQFYCLADLAAALGVASAQLRPLAPVLAFCHYDRDSPITPQPLSLNQATSQQLCTIPGMPPDLAQTIVWERLRRGNYQDLADLQTRLQLSPDTIQRLMYYLQT
ncbi:ComEA family DNA-binding protein [Nodosilinea sp. P-1105]|uniref:ComEA family DNA-binding protein n=1 Tax=Nodosilinea sp. P-1105 TaxID=2546229 RepID=UPI003242312B